MAKPNVVVLVCVTALAFLGGNQVHAQDAQEYIVQFRDGTRAETRGAAATAAGASVRFDYDRLHAAAVRVPNERALIALQQHPSVVSIVPNRPVFAYQRAYAKGGKPGGGGQGQVLPAGVDRVAGRPAPSDGAGVGVAILDTGIDLAHPDLGGPVDAFSAYGPSCQDDEGHGTHVAGTVAARDNAIDVIGVAPGAQLFCVKVLDGTGRGSDATVIAGLNWVLDTVSAWTDTSLPPPIRVVNMSLGRAGTVDDNPTMRDVVAALDAAGVSIVVAAGNDAAADVSGQIPAAYPEVISVASTTALGGSNQCRFLSAGIARDTASYFTTDGTGVTVSAPGEEKEDVKRGCFIQSTGILSTRLGGGTTRLSGTSMAAPHVAGIAARYHQQADVDEAGSYTPAFVRSLIISNAYQTPTASLPLDSPAASYSFDGIREGIAQAPPSVPVP